MNVNPRPDNDGQRDVVLLNKPSDEMLAANTHAAVTAATGMSTDPVHGKRHNSSHWTVADIEWQRIDHERVRDNLSTYYVVTGASFVETAADLYTANLVQYFPDPKVQNWLLNYWQPEELQHGLALRKYVETVWPELDWEAGYRNFLASIRSCVRWRRSNPAEIGRAAVRGRV